MNRDAAESYPKPVGATRVALLLPAVYVLHFLEEWHGGLLVWVSAATGYAVSEARFVLINAVALPVFVAAALAAVRRPRFAWCAAALATLLGLNGLLHALGSLLLNAYMPGTITGLLLYLPLSVMVLRNAAASLTSSVYRRAVLCGVGLHAMISLVAAIGIQRA